jgi:hypothetical protein
MKPCLTIKSETADSEKRSKPNCKAKVIDACARRKIVRTLPMRQAEKVNKAILRKDGKTNREE